jgi:hypothetical protein
VLDRGGNRSEIAVRSALRDETAPEVLSIQVPAALAGGITAAFAAQVADENDLGSGSIALRFEAMGVGSLEFPFTAAAPLGQPFSGVLTTDAFLQASFPLPVGLEPADAGPLQDGPSGTVFALSGVRATVRDAARNAASESRSVSGVVGPGPRGFSVLERGEEGGVRGWELIPMAAAVCRAEGGDTCPEGVGQSVPLRAVARGREGLFARPFERVHFYRIHGGEAEWLGVSGTATVSEGTGERGREWSWELTWTPRADAPLGDATLRAVGVDAGGSGLITGEDGSLAVVEGG